jgi:WD40 repeat protein
MIGHSELPHAVAVFADGRKVVSGSWDKTVKIWDAESGEELLTIGHIDRVFAVAVFADGKRVVSASGELDAPPVRCVVKIWDAESGAELCTMSGHSELVRAVAVFADGKRVVSGSNDRTVKIWDAESGAELCTMSGHSDWVDKVAVSADGRKVMSGSSDKTVKIWDAESGAELCTMTGHVANGGSMWDYGCGMNAVAVFADSTKVVSGSGICGDLTVKVWDMESGQLIWSTEIAGFDSVNDGATSVEAVVVSADGSGIVSADTTTASTLVAPSFTLSNPAISVDQISCPDSMSQTFTVRSPQIPLPDTTFVLSANTATAFIPQP